MNAFLNTIKHAVIEEIMVMPADFVGGTGHWFNGVGWYFADETEMFVGPYETKILAQVAMYHYCMFLELGQATPVLDTHQDEIDDVDAGHPHPGTELMFAVRSFCGMRLACFGSYDEAEEYRLRETDHERLMIEAIEEDEDLFHGINR